MKNKWPIIAIILIVLVIGFIGAKRLISSNDAKNPQVEGTETSSSNQVKLEIFSTGVSVENSGESNWTAAADQEVINVGTEIKTDTTGRAQLVYPNGTVTRIDKNSQITLKSFQNQPFNADVTLEIGSVWSRIVKLLGGESYQTDSTTLVASVRGTSFGQTILPNGQNEIIVTKHTVQVDCVANKNNASVTMFQKTTTDCKTNLKVLALTKTDEADEWYQFNLSQDELLDARFGANTYNDEATPTATPKVLGTHTTAPAPTATPTPNPTATATSSPTSTPTPTMTATPTATPTPTPGRTNPIIYRPVYPIIIATPTPYEPVIQ